MIKDEVHYRPADGRRRRALDDVRGGAGIHAPAREELRGSAALSRRQTLRDGTAALQHRHLRHGSGTDMWGQTLNAPRGKMHAERKIHVAILSLTPYVVSSCFLQLIKNIDIAE